MTKKILIILLLLLGINLYAESSYDRTVEVLDSTREEKVKQVFRELINAYQDEDARQFFEFVSEDRFLQDYITFSDGIYQDFRYYDILQVDYYFDQVVPKGIKRFLYVRWEKRYERLDTAEQFTQIGYSRFLFDEIDGKYYLIELAGNNLWADSVEEWREEVPSISGQVVYPQAATSSTTPTNPGSPGNPAPPPPAGKPDLTILNLTRPPGGAMNVEFDIANIGTAANTAVTAGWTISGGYSGDAGVIQPGDSVHVSKNTLDGYPGDTITVVVDPDLFIDELDKSNNTASYTIP